MLKFFSLLILASFPIFAGDLTGKYEVSAFGGTANRGSGNDGNFGGNFGYGLTGKTMVFAEFTRNVGGFRYMDVHGGLKQILMTRGRFEPYVLGGLGIVRMPVFAGPFAGHTTYVSVNAGFGARFYIGQRWGVQPEFRWMRFLQNAVSDVNLLRTTGGIFLQWGE
jgi:hypothetical protein